MDAAVFILLTKSCLLIIITAFGKGKPFQKGRQWVFILQGIDDHCLFPVFQGALVDARIFFRTLIVFSICKSPSAYPASARGAVQSHWLVTKCFPLSGCPAVYFYHFLKQQYLRGDIFSARHILALVYPISSDTDLILSPSSNQRCSTSIFTSKDGFLGCPAVLTWVNSFRGGLDLHSFPIHVYKALLVG